MATYVVVANLTLGGEHLLEILRHRCTQGPCRIRVLVPASAGPQGWTHTEQQDLAEANRRLDEAMARFSGLGEGVEVTGAVGDRPVDMILDAVRTEDVDEIILSTLPVGVSRWLRLDLVHRVQRAVPEIPVTHVMAAAEPAGTGS